MPFDPTFALSTALPLAEAAYDLSKLPPDWRLIGTVEPDNFGFVAVRENVVAIGLRGTQTPEDVVTDIDVVLVSSLYSVGMVSKGTQDAYTQVRPSLLDLLALAEATVPVSKSDLKLQVLIVGHSLGGNLATHCAADRATGGFDKSVYLFASPKTGDKQFATDFDTRNPNCSRIANIWDIVNDYPVLPGYEHVHQEVLVNGGFPKDPATFVTTAHSLELSYKVGLQKLVKPPA